MRASFTPSADDIEGIKLMRSIAAIGEECESDEENNLEGANEDDDVEHEL
jgi:hypothetical protein